jgi:lipopolysaccharide export LptBFGC system permease protein LptF
MAERAAPRHRELMRGMVSELDAIAEPGERRRFAVGAIAAIVRLALSGYGEAVVHAGRGWIVSSDAEAGTHSGGPSMSMLTTRQLLRRHATPFAATFASLTGLLLANQAFRQFPALSARGVPVGTKFEVLLLSLPHTLALAIPMAVFVAVTWVFTRLGEEGVLAAARRGGHGNRRLFAPVVIAATVIAALTFVSNTRILPRANARLAAVLADAPRTQSDRTMTIGELHEAARSARADAAADGAARAAAYEVEIQKKFALAAACMVLALAGAAIPLRFPRGGARLVIGASAVVFAGYYVTLIAGESLADRLVISPFLAMWTANAFLLAIVLLLVWRGDRQRATGAAGSLAIGG